MYFKPLLLLFAAFSALMGLFLLMPPDKELPRVVEIPTKIFKTKSPVSALAYNRDKDELFVATFDKALIVACFYLLDENESLKKQIFELGEEIKRLEEGAKLLIKPNNKLAP